MLAASVKIMCAEMIFNGGNIMVGDHCGEDVDRTDAAITISHEVAPGRAEDVAKAFDNEGGNIVDPPSMQFWGQGRCTPSIYYRWKFVSAFFLCSCVLCY